MSDINKLLDSLKSMYEDVVTQKLNTERVSSQKYALFAKNVKRIDTSLHYQLKQFDQTLTDMKETFKTHVSEQEKQKKASLKNFKNAQKKHYESHASMLKDIEETYEKKRTLCGLKEEKIEYEQHANLKQIDQRFEKVRIKLDKTLEESTKTFYDKTIELKQETETKTNNEETDHQKRLVELSNQIDDVKSKTDKELNNISKKITDYEARFAKQLNELTQEYNAATKPIQQELKTMNDTQKQDIEEIKAHFNTEIGKKEKYKKEKEKISDYSAAGDFSKAIKKLTKQQKETLAKKQEVHEKERVPLEKKQTDMTEMYQKKFFTIKKQALEKIALFLNSIQVVKTNDLIDTNVLNTEILQNEAHHTHRTKAIKIDHDIQSINFDQTLEENRLGYEYGMRKAEIEASLEKESTRANYRENINALKEQRAHTLSVKEYDIEYAKHTLRNELEQTTHNKKVFEENHNYEKNVFLIENAVQKLHKDYEKEKILITHYHLKAKNYTALKMETLQGIRPYTEIEIKTGLTHKIAMYQNQLKKAQSDHNHITDSIHETYKKEIKIYESAYENIVKEHEQAVQNLVNTQAEERQNDLLRIEKLDSKKDKARIKEHRKNLATKHARHDEALAMKKRELEGKQTLYQNMLENIKNFKLHSLEEAETLLMHIKDQLNHMIEQVKISAQKDQSLYQTLIDETLHSADLFETFQHQRQQDTLQSAKEYLDKRMAKEETAKNALKMHIDKGLEQLETAWNHYQQKQSQALDELQQKHHKNLERISKVHTDNLKTIREETAHEKQRLNQLLSREKRQYDTYLKELTQGKNIEKDACFKRKEKSEDALKNTLERLHKEQDDYQNQRETLKLKDLAHIEHAAQGIIETLKDDAIHQVIEKEISGLKKRLQS